MHSKDEHVMRGRKHTVSTVLRLETLAEKWTCWPMLVILALKKLRKEDQLGLHTQ